MKRHAGKTEEFDLADVPDLHDDDMLTFRANNKGQRPVDLTVLFVDSRYGVEPWFPYASEVNRVRPGETASSELVVNLKTVGIEHWIFITAAVEPATPATNFSFLAHEGLVTRAGAAAPRVPAGQATILDLLLGAGLPEAGIRGGGRRPVALAGAASFSWNVVAETTD